MNKKINDALQEIRSEYITDAAAVRKRRPYWIAAVAAALAVVILLSFFPGVTPNDPTEPQLQETLPRGTGIVSPDSLVLANLVAGPYYPEMVQMPNYSEYNNDYAAYSDAYQLWYQDQKAQYDQPKGYADSLTGFFADTMAQFLEGNENKAYSPLNVYMALAMLAETAGGNSRQQLLDLLGLDTIEQLRQQASLVWNAHYSNDGKTTLLMANSLWLDEAYSFDQNTASTLASSYYASAFSGDLGTDQLNQQLHSWLNANTGGLLEQQTKNVQLSPEAVFSLASTMYFSANWSSQFSKNKTEVHSFHGMNGDTRAAFMKDQFFGRTYYRGSNFGAIHLELSGDSKMWLILPDEGYTVENILEGSEYAELTLDPAAWEDKAVYDVNLSLPKFDIAYQQDLVEGIQKLGVTDIFDSSLSDFTPMTAAPALYVGQINHAARVAIDEEGCTAAAFTVITMYGTALPQPHEELDFVLDRPFLFVVSSRDNLPLFAGTVLEP